MGTKSVFEELMLYKSHVSWAPEARFRFAWLQVKCSNSYWNRPSVPSFIVIVRNIDSPSSLGKPDAGAEIFGVALVSGFPKITLI